MSENKILFPSITSFEEYVKELSSNEGSQMAKAMWIPTSILYLSLFGGLFSYLYLVNTLSYEPVVAVAVLMIFGMGALLGYDRFKNYVVDNLRGKDVLDIIIRIRPGFYLDFWAVLKEGSPKIIPVSDYSIKGLSTTLFGNNSVILVEYEFEDCMYFKKMVALLPCTPDKLSRYSPGPIIHKSFITPVSKTKVSFGLLKVISLGEDGFIPFVCPIDSDYAVEEMQKLAGVFKISEKEAELAPVIYDNSRYLEVLPLLEQKDREIQAKDALIGDVDVKAELLAAKLSKLKTKGTETKKERSFNAFGWLIKHKLAFFLVVMLTFGILAIWFGLII